MAYRHWHTTKDDANDGNGGGVYPYFPGYNYILYNTAKSREYNSIISTQRAHKTYILHF